MRTFVVISFAIFILTSCGKAQSAASAPSSFEQPRHADNPRVRDPMKKVYFSGPGA